MKEHHIVGRCRWEAHSPIDDDVPNNVRWNNLEESVDQRLVSRSVRAGVSSDIIVESKNIEQELSDTLV
jgi:hypothetical protein